MTGSFRQKANIKRKLQVMLKAISAENTALWTACTTSMLNTAQGILQQAQQWKIFHYIINSKLLNYNCTSNKLSLICWKHHKIVKYSLHAAWNTELQCTFVVQNKDVLPTNVEQTDRKTFCLVEPYRDGLAACEREDLSSSHSCL